MPLNYIIKSLSLYGKFGIKFPTLLVRGEKKKGEQVTILTS